MSAPGVVITPELFGRSLREAAAHQVLRVWQEGRLSPSMNRSLLKRYLQVLQGMGIVEEQLLRAWVWTWTRNEGVVWDEGTDLEDRNGASGWVICQNLARARGVPVLFSDGAEEEGGDALRSAGVEGLSLSGFADWLSGQGM